MTRKIKNAEHKITSSPKYTLKIVTIKINDKEIKYA